jgi:hypothetical protein
MALLRACAVPKREVEDMEVLDGRFRQQACAAPGPTEGVRNTVGKVCFSSGAAFGPAEWIWRAFTNRRRFPLMRSS